MIYDRIPAPYEMGNPETNSFAKGGRPHHKGMVIAHMNSKECDILDHLQGKSEKCPRTGVRTYRHLEELLKNPHLVETVHHHARQHHAEGGSTTEHLREGGRYGDTELASIGPNTRHLFDTLGGNPPPNPNTGHPEYFSINGALSGLWNTLKGVGKSILPAAQNIGRSLLPAAKEIGRSVLPTLAPMAQQALGDRFGGIGKTIGGALPGLANSALGEQEGPTNPFAQAVANGINKGVGNYQTSGNAKQAFGQGLQAAGQGFGGGVGSAMQNAGSSLEQGKGYGSALQGGMKEGFNQMGGTQGLGNIAKTAMGAYNRGGLNAARQAATGQMSNFAQRALPQKPQQDPYDLGDYGRNMFNEQ